jgi:hypothetical protein
LCPRNWGKCPNGDHELGLEERCLLRLNPREPRGLFEAAEVALDACEDVFGLGHERADEMPQIRKVVFMFRWALATNR